MKHVKKYWPLVLIFALSLFVTWPLFKYGYFSHQDDLQIIRIYEMRKCFSDLQLPCRWTPDMGWGNGSPMFNFYGVSLYYIAALLSYVVGFIISSKIIFYISLVAGSVGMYLLIKSIWGKIPATTAAVLYMFAPYKALDIYVRGALAESFALAVIPFVFYFAYQLIMFPAKRINGIIFSISLFVFMTTHNIMVLLFLPALICWVIYWLSYTKWKILGRVIVYSIFGFLLSAFFILPAFFEKNMVQSESMTRFELDFRANYLKVKQLFLDRMWGYGTSIPGPDGGMNFQIGWPHWILATASLIIVFINKKKNKWKVLTLLIFAVYIFSVFMTHNKSTFIWTHVDLLKYFQFPWRFLSLTIFTASILGGIFVSIFDKRASLIISACIILLSIYLNWEYFKPKEFYTINDSQKLSGELWNMQTKGALLDYLPKTALEPRQQAENLPIIVEGKGEIIIFDNKSNRWFLDVNMDEKGIVEIPVFYFPNWEVYINGRVVPFSYENILGRISLSLDEGTYKMYGKFNNTPIRVIGNALTIFGFFGLVGYYLKYEKNKKPNR